MNRAIVVRTVVCAVFVLSAWTAVSAQEFLPYEGKNAFQEGEGGTKKVVDGIDFWADGAPPKPFKLLGYISDRRHKSGLVGMVRMSGLESDVAELTKKSGGDAVILVSAEAETVGTVGNSYGQAQGTANTMGGSTTARMSGWSTGSSAAVQKQQTKYAVVKYVERAKTSEIPTKPAEKMEGKSLEEVAKPPSPPPTN